MSVKIASIFFTQERDDVGLLTIEPAAQDRDQQLEREHTRSYVTAVDPSMGHYGVRSSCSPFRFNAVRRRTSCSACSITVSITVDFNSASVL